MTEADVYAEIGEACAISKPGREGDEPHRRRPDPARVRRIAAIGQVASPGNHLATSPRCARQHSPPSRLPQPAWSFEYPRSRKTPVSSGSSRGPMIANICVTWPAARRRR